MSSAESPSSELETRNLARLPVELAQFPQPALHLGDDVLPLKPVPLGLLGVPDDHEPPAGLAVAADDHFLDLKPVTKGPVGARTAQGLGRESPDPSRSFSPRM